MQAASPSLSFSTPAWKNLRIIAAMLERDVTVLAKQWPYAVARVTMQPLLLAFTFAYIFPMVGEGIGGASGANFFASLLVPGLLTMNLFLNGIQAVTVPLVTDLGSSQEIADRASGPLPLVWLAAEKVCAGAAEGCMTTPLIAVLAAIVPSAAVHLNISWGATILLSILVAVCGATLGLLLGVAVRTSQIQTMFTILVLPMTYLGASFYPWTALGSTPWLKWLITINPLMYANESLRAAMTPQIPHVPPIVSSSFLLLSSILFFGLGVRGLRRRLENPSR